MRTLNCPGTRRRLALLAVVALAVTAGCLGGGGDGDDGTTGIDGQDDGVEDPAGGENGTDGDETDGTDVPDPGNLAAEDVPRLGDIEPVESDISSEELLTASLNELESVQEYKYRVVSLQRQGNDSRLRETIRQVKIDKRSGNADSYLSVGGRDQREYLVDGFAYARDEAYVEQFGSEWLKQDVSENTEQLLDEYDLAGEIIVRFRNAEATIEGEGTYQDETVYVVTADVDEAAIEEYYGQSDNDAFEFTNIEFTAWISAESERPLRIEQVSESTGENGTAYTVEEVTTFNYSPVEVTLPDAAVDAPSIDELREESDS